jgi:hypothetical protein
VIARGKQEQNNTERGRRHMSSEDALVVKQAFSNAGALLFMCVVAYLVYMMSSILLPFYTPLVSSRRESWAVMDNIFFFC